MSLVCDPEEGVGVGSWSGETARYPGVLVAGGQTGVACWQAARRMSKAKNSRFRNNPMIAPGKEDKIIYVKCNTK